MNSGSKPGYLRHTRVQLGSPKARCGNDLWLWVLFGKKCATKFLKAMFQKKVWKTRFRNVIYNYNIFETCYNESLITKKVIKTKSINLASFFNFKVKFIQSYFRFKVKRSVSTLVKTSWRRATTRGASTTSTTPSRPSCCHHANSHALERSPNCSGKHRIRLKFVGALPLLCCVATIVLHMRLLHVVAFSK